MMYAKGHEKFHSHGTFRSGATAPGVRQILGVVLIDSGAALYHKRVVESVIVGEDANARVERILSVTFIKKKYM